MNRGITSALLVVAASVATLGAQYGSSMGKDRPMISAERMDKMAAESTYTGCLQPGKSSGAFVLTNAVAADESMQNLQKMAHADERMGGTMMADETMSGDMKSMTLTLAGKSVEFRKHVGQKVSVSGTTSADGGMAKDATLTVKSLKVIARACS
jgi:hypothetical protein